MDVELDSCVERWQKIVQAQHAWLAEIEGRHGVHFKREVSCMRICIRDPDHPSPALEEVDEMRDAVLDAYQHMTLTDGDPRLGRLRYRQSANLFGRAPLQAIAEDSLASGCIDMVLIGPEDQVVALCSRAPLLLAAARGRAESSPGFEGEWITRTRRIAARVDSMRAVGEIEKIMEMNSNAQKMLTRNQAA